MLEKRLTANLDSIARGEMQISPDIGLTALHEQTTDSCEINYDKKTGEIKTIKVKAYDTTIEGAVDAALEGLERARFPPAGKMIRIYQDEDGDFVPQVDVRMTRSERIEATDALYQMLQRLGEKEDEEATQKGLEDAKSLQILTKEGDE